MTEQEKMLKGQLYDASDEELCALRHKANSLCLKYNSLEEDDPLRQKILEELIPLHNGVYINAPIHMDYGKNISFGKDCFVNYNFTVLDCAPIRIGNHVQIGPNVTIASALHPLRAEERRTFINERGVLGDREYALPITIEDDCWIASNVVITAGVTIGEGSVIGAGSVVLHDIPAHSLAAGVPCKVIREITEKDSIYHD